MMYRALFRKLMFVQALSILSTTVAVIIDSSITSLFLGQTALSAAGIVMPLVQFFATIGGSVAVGFQTVVARKLGQGDSDGASALFNFILIFTLFLSAVSATCVFFLSGPLAELLGTTRGTYEYTQAAGYLKGYAIGIPAYSLMLLLTPVMFIDSDKNRVEQLAKADISMGYVLLDGVIYYSKDGKINAYTIQTKQVRAIEKLSAVPLGAVGERLIVWSENGYDLYTKDGEKL